MTRMHASVPSLDGSAIDVLRDCAIPLPDGSGALAADVYLPRTGRPCPALVTLLPYHKDAIAGIDGWRANRYFAAHGYACVLVDFRGTGGSSGLPRPPFHDGEADDGVAAVEWAAAQPWCDGAVGMWGASYGAMTALRTAARRPPALRAIAGVIGHADHGREFVHPGGVRACLPPLASWGLTTLGLQLMPPLHQDRDGRWLRNWRERLEAVVPYAVDLARRDPRDSAPGAWAIDVAAIEVPTFCVGGWRDLNCEGTLRTFAALRAPKRLLMGPWMHTLPDDSPFAPADFLALATRWWDRWLREEDNGVDGEPPVTLAVQGGERWLELDRWPPAAGGELAWRAGGDGTLGPDAAGPARDSRLDVDPTVGTGGGLWSLPTRGFGLPEDQHDDDARSLAFTTAPLAEPLLVVGHPRLRAMIEVEACRTLVVKLACVDSAGRSTLLTTGTLGLEDDGPAAVEVELQGTSVELSPGERLRLVVAGADFPRLWPDERPGRLTILAGQATLLLPGPPDASETAPPPWTPGDTPHPLLLRAEPAYAVTRDRVADAVTLSLGEHLLARTPDGAGTLDLEQSITATVAREHPEAARAEGHATWTSTGPHGTIVARADLVLRHHLTSATGSVSWDGTPIFERRWTA